MARLAAAHPTPANPQTRAGQPVLSMPVVIHAAGHWIMPVSTTMAAGDLARLDRSVDQAIQRGLVVAGAIRVFQCAREVWRIATTRDAAPALA